MKILKRLAFFLILMIPIFVNAITFGNYDSGVVGANEYINKFQDRNKYLNFDMKYEFRDSNSYKNNDFKYGGLLSVFEYNTSKKGNGSYLATGREYWTLSKDGSNQYYVDNTLLSKNPDEQSGIRVTEFVKSEVNVKGNGTYVNPWMFREQFSVEARSSNKSQGTVSPEYQMINPGNKARLTISPLTGYKYSNSDCKLLHISGNNYDTQVINRDTACTIYFEIRKITINYSCTGGSGSIASQTVKYNDPYTIADYNQCTRTGYTQTGWKTSDGSTWTPGSYEHMTVENGQRGLVNDTLNLQPVWKANNYTITYYLGNGTNTAGVTSIGTQSCTYGTSCTLKSFSSFGKTLPYSTTPSGACDYQWSFYGWTDTQTGMTKKYGDAESFTYNKEGNMSLYVLESRYLHFNTGVAPTTDTEIRQYWNPYSSSDTYVSAITIPPRTTISGWSFIGYKGGSSAATADVDYGASSPGETVKPLPSACRFFRSKYTRTLTIKYNTGGTGTVADSAATQYYNSGYASSGENKGSQVNAPTFTLRSGSGLSKTGYSFSKWAVGSLNGTKYDDGVSYSGFKPSLNESTTQTMYAVFAANSYTITYYQGNGTATAGTSSIGTQTCKYDSTCTLKTYSSFGKTLPNSTTPSGACDYQWGFYGWVNTKTGMTRSYADGASFTYKTAGNMSLFVLESRLVHFNSGVAPTTDETIRQYWNPYSTSTDYLSAITIPNKVTISGWSFIGYKGGSNEADSSVDYGSSSPGTSVQPSPTTCRFFRSKYSRTLTISYDGNGATSGSVSNSTATQYYNSGYASSGSNVGAKVNAPEFTLRANGFSRTYYTFNKWAAGSTNGNLYAAQGAYSGFGPGVSATNTTQTMYAIWNANTYKITYNANGGSGEPSPTTYTYATSGTVNLSSTKPTRSNYTFVGWSQSSNATTASYSAGQAWNKSNANNYTLYAVWKASCSLTNYTGCKKVELCYNGTDEITAIYSTNNKNTWLQGSVKAAGSNASKAIYIIGYDTVSGVSNKMAHVVVELPAFCTGLQAYYKTAGVSYTSLSGCNYSDVDSNMGLSNGFKLLSTSKPIYEGWINSLCISENATSTWHTNCKKPGHAAFCTSV